MLSLLSVSLRPLYIPVFFDSLSSLPSSLILVLFLRSPLSIECKTIISKLQQIVVTSGLHGLGTKGGRKRPQNRGAR